MRGLIAVVMAMTNAAGFAADPVEILQTYAYYNIAASSIPELHAQLTRGGPLDDSGRTHQGFTNSYITWRYPLERDAKGCSTGPVSVQVQVHMQLPRWTRTASAAADVASYWDRLIAALLVHEDGHKQIAVDGARRIAATLSRLPAEASCPAMSAKANTEGQRLLAEIRAAQTRYDQLTDHGRNQRAASLR